MWKALVTLSVLLSAGSCSPSETMPAPSGVSSDLATPPPARLPWSHVCSERDFPVDLNDREYAGLYDREFERSAFTLENSSCTVWLTGNLDKACELVGGCQKGSRFRMHLNLSGRLSSAGSYGHLGAYERELQVHHVVTGTVIPQ